MIKDIIIFGAGGFGRETALMINQINEDKPRFNIIGFMDDAVARNTEVDGYPVLGSSDQVGTVARGAGFIIAVANPSVRRKLAAGFQKRVSEFPTLVHPSASLGDRRNKFGHGLIITASTIMTTGISVNDFVIVNLAATIGHDVKIGAYSTLMPACHISGMVTIGEECMIGTGACVLQNLSIGFKARVGAGAVVTKNVSEGVTVVGIPAKIHPDV